MKKGKRLAHQATLTLPNSDYECLVRIPENNIENEIRTTESIITEIVEHLPGNVLRISFFFPLELNEILAEIFCHRILLICFYLVY
jgi:hypothetical protein